MAKWTIYQSTPQGLSLARKIAMISYRSNVSFENKFGRSRIEGQKISLKRGTVSRLKVI